jgi:hypothetical protein
VWLDFLRCFFRVTLGNDAEREMREMGERERERERDGWKSVSLQQHKMQFPSPLLFFTMTLGSVPCASDTVSASPAALALSGLRDDFSFDLPFDDVVIDDDDDDTARAILSASLAARDVKNSNFLVLFALCILEGLRVEFDVDAGAQCSMLMLRLMLRLRSGGCHRFVVHDCRCRTAAGAGCGNLREPDPEPGLWTLDRRRKSFVKSRLKALRQHFFFFFSHASPTALATAVN